MQRAAIGDAALLHGEIKAALIEFYSTLRGVNKAQRKAAWEKTEAGFTRLDGRAAQLLITFLSAYPDSRVPAAYDKLRDRFRATRNLLQGDPPPSARLFRTALGWIDEQVEVLLRLAAPPEKQPGYGRGRAVWVGIGKNSAKKWAQKVQEYSNVDRAPPWEPEVRLFLHGMSRKEHESSELRRWTFEQVKNVRCPQHERAPHITLFGRFTNFTIEIEACCPALVAMTKDALPGLQSRGASEITSACRA